MRIASLAIASAIALAASAHVADASPPTIWNRVWTSVGNGCVVADESATLYDSRGAGIGFLSGKTGTIRAYCPITTSTNGSSPQYYGLGMSYNESSTTGQSITATLRKVADGSNAASTICTATGTGTGLAVDYCTFFGAPVALSTTYSYYVQIEVTRTTTSVDPELLSVFLFN